MCNWSDEKELSDINFERLKKVLVYMKNCLINFDMYLTADSLTDTNIIITGLNNITLRKVHVKPYGYDKKYTWCPPWCQSF